MFCSILNCIAPLEARHELSHIHLSPGPAVVSVLHSLSPPSLTQHRLGLSDSDHRLGDLAACVVQTLFVIGEMVFQSLGWSLAPALVPFNLVSPLHPNHCHPTVASISPIPSMGYPVTYKRSSGGYVPSSEP